MYFQSNERAVFQLYCRLDAGRWLVGQSGEVDWRPWHENPEGYAVWLDCGSNAFKASVGIGVRIAKGLRINEPAVKPDPGPPV